jgi:hypothetical protein
MFGTVVPLSSACEKLWQMPLPLRLFGGREDEADSSLRWREGAHRAAMGREVPLTTMGTSPSRHARHAGPLPPQRGGEVDGGLQATISF